MDAFCRRNTHRHTSRERLFSAGQDIWRKEYRDSKTVEDDVTAYCKDVDAWCSSVPSAKNWCVARSTPSSSQPEKNYDDDDIVCLTPTVEALPAVASTTTSRATAVETTRATSPNVDPSLSPSLIAFLSSLDLEPAVVLPEDVRGNSDLMTALEGFAPLAVHFDKVHRQYKGHSKFHRATSKLADSIAAAKAVLAKVKTSLIDISAIGSSAQAAVTHQSISAMLGKLEKITELFKYVVASKSTMNDAIRHLTRRVCGLHGQELQPDNVRLMSGAKPDMTWDDACTSAEDLCLNKKSAGLSLSGQELLNCFAIVLEEHAVPVTRLFQEARIPPTKTSTTAALNGCIWQLVNSGPMLHVSCGSKQVITDIHCFSLRSHGSNIAELLCLCDDSVDVYASDLLNEEQVPDNDDALLSQCNGENPQDAAQMQTEFADSRASHRGRPRKHDQFPSIVQKTLEYLEAHGCEAQRRRRAETTSCLGISLKDLRKHLLASVPGLKEKGISRTAIHELMMPPRQKTVNAGRYKSLVNSRVPKKQNNRAFNDHADSHFCASQVKIVMEFSAKYKSVQLVSADDMNKVNIGGPAVSR